MTDKLLIEALERIANPMNKHFAGDAQVVAREALAAYRSQKCHKCNGNGITHAEFCPLYDREREIKAVQDYRSQQEAAQEPVAWGYLSGKEWRITTDPQMVEAMAQASGLKVRPLYTAPAPAESEARKPLTDDQIKAFYHDGHWWELGNAPFTWGAASVLIRAVERAHGITNAALSASGQKDAT